MTNLKATKKVSVLAVLMLSLQAHAIFDPNWERPIERVALEIIDSQRGFDLVSDLEVTVRKRDGALYPTSLVVNYNQAAGEMLPAFQSIEEEFVINENEITIDACGSIHYSASIVHKNEDERVIGARTNVTLIDHRDRACRDLVPGLVEFRMRKGYGWCGTMDATLHAVGEPEGLFSAYIK